MAAVASTHHSLHDDVTSHRLEVIRPTDDGEKVDKRSSDVQSVVAQFGSFVVPREGVMVVVPTLAQRQRRDRVALRRVDSPGNYKLRL